MEIFTTQTLITVAIFLAIYAFLQRRTHKKQKSQNKINHEYLKILNSEEYRVK